VFKLATDLFLQHKFSASKAQSVDCVDIIVAVVVGFSF